MNETLKTSAGVERLIEKLRNDGVKAGEEEAKRVLDDAGRKAAEIMARARAEADEYLNKARAEIEKERASAQESLHLALRDSILQLKETLIARFKSQVKEVVREDLSDKEFLKQIILAIAAKAAPPAGTALDVLVGDEGPGKEHINSLIIALSRDMIRDGVQLTPSTRTETGIRVGLRGTDMEIDLTDQAISSLILSHLTPRFRQMMEGMGK